MNRSNPYSVNQTDSIESRLSARLAAGLSERSLELPHDIGERLRVAREQAVTRAREARKVVAAPHVTLVGRGGAAAALGLGGPTPWWLRMATALPVLVLAAGLLLVEHMNAREQVLAAAEIDAVLLADDLPPAAYSDPGFREYLKSPIK